MRIAAPLCIAALLATTALTPAAEAAGEIGTTKEVRVAAYGTVPGRSTAPKYRNDDVFTDERIQTVRTGGMRIEFVDETELWIGEDSEVVLDAFVYDPSSGTGEFVAELGTGLFRFVTGELQSEGFQIKTPVATIGVRGTDFSVLVALSGAIAVACYVGNIYITPIGTGASVSVTAGQTGKVSTADGIVSVATTSMASPPAGVSAGGGLGSNTPGMGAEVGGGEGGEGGP